MAKSSRSNWKKIHKRQRALAERPNVVKRLQQLNSKLKLVSNGGISAVPTEEPEKRFHFSAPTVKADERLVLEPMTTNPHGKSNPNAPHPQTTTFERVAFYQPTAGHAVSHADMARKESALAQEQPADDAEDDAVEFTIGCNDDEHLTSATLKPMPSHSSRIKSMQQGSQETSGARKIKVDGGKKRMTTSTGTKNKKK